MADKAISELAQATKVTDNDLFVLQQDGTAKKLPGSTLKNYVVLDVVSAEAQTLPAGSKATASYDKGNKKLKIGVPVGPTGATGATGPQGVQGATGPQGPQGPKGPQGERGATGAPGARGNRVWTTFGYPEDNSANGVQVGDLWIVPAKYGDLSQNDLATYTGTPHDWEFVCHMEGTDGSTWYNGTKDPTEYDLTVRDAKVGDYYLNTSDGYVWQRQMVTDSSGMQGAQWVGIGNIRGPQGIQGIQGPQGVKGPQGIQGDTGPQGPQGPQGKTGPQGERGPTGPQGPQGVKGDTGAGFVVKGYYATASALSAAVTSPATGDAYGVGTGAPYDIYIYDGVGKKWVNNGPLQGAKGDPGPQGPQGIQGPQGEKGATGAAGATGPQGPKGATGPQGEKGATGATGPKGPQGEKGATGPQGPKPVKGTDYWTAADKSAMVNDVLAALPVWNGGSY